MNSTNDWLNTQTTIPTSIPSTEPYNIFDNLGSSDPHQQGNGFTAMLPRTNNTFAMPALPVALPTGSTSSTPATETSTANEGDRNVNMAEYLDPADRYLQTNPPKVPFFTCQPGPIGRIDSIDAAGQVASIPAEPDPSELHHPFVLKLAYGYSHSGDAERS